MAYRKARVYYVTMSQYYTQLSCIGRACGLFETAELNEIAFPKVSSI